MRLLDMACSKCGLIREDIWDDELPVSCECGGEMVKVLLHSPHMDACVPVERTKTTGKEFLSHRHMEKYAKQTGQAVFSPKEYERMKKTTTEERLKKKHGALREIVEKTYYRVTHGYKDAPERPKVKEAT